MLAISPAKYILYNELLVRGFAVDVGIVPYTARDTEGKLRRQQLEVDFACNSGDRRYDIQSAFAIPDQEKMDQEQRPLSRIDDAFTKIIVVRDGLPPWRNERGILVMDILDFLLTPNSLGL